MPGGFKNLQMNFYYLALPSYMQGIDATGAANMHVSHIQVYAPKMLN